MRRALGSSGRLQDEGVDLDRKTCVEPSNPATDCRKKGWTWTGRHCVEPQKKIETPRKTCPAGTVGTPPACKILQIRKCPPGTKGVFPRCTKG